MARLAIDGGDPVRETKIHYSRQYIDEDDIQSVIEVLKSEYLTCGPKIAELEKKLCNITGAAYSAVLSNGTSALHVACIAAGIKEGDEVITTPMTFAASANCVLYCGAKPIFADINPETYNIDPAAIESKITEKTKAVIAVDFTGQVAELDRIKDICQRYHLVLIEDGAHSIGTKYKDIPVGNISDITTFSFHPVKTVTGGEGGAVLTNNKEFHQRVKLLRTHGITREVKELKNASHGEWYYEQVNLGFNYRITDLQASLIASQLNKLDKFKQRKTEIVTLYNKAFKDIPEIVLQKEIPESDTLRHLYIIQLVLEKLHVSRKQIFNALAAENICCNVHYIPIYYFPYYQRMGYKKGICPNAEKLYERIITIPLFYSMTNNDVQDVVRAVRKVIDNYKKRNL